MTKNKKIALITGVLITVLLVGTVAYQNKQTQEQLTKLAGGVINYRSNQNNEPKPTASPTSIKEPTEAPQTETGATDPKNATYTIEGKQVTLVNGSAQESAAPGSASVVKTTMFDEPTMGDLNGDGVNDAGVMLVVSGSGTGTFYYAAAALNNDSAYTGTNAVLLGDSIAPQTKSIQNQVFTVNYADRKPDEPMTANPSVGVTKNFTVNGTTLVEE